MASPKLLGERYRIVGLETEFGVHATGEINGDTVRTRTTRQKPGDWYPAGILYRDMGNAEGSTNESFTGHEIVVRTRALEAALQAKIAAAYTAAERTQIWLLKNNTGRAPYRGSFRETTHGSHECYLRRLSHAGRPPESNETVVSQLAPFFATRQIFAGAGSVVVNEATGEWRFEISQRGRHIEELFYFSAVYQRGFIKSRNLPYADPQIYRRFELIIGDSNILYEPEAYKVDITSLMLLMQENRSLPQVRLKSPVLTIQTVARDGLAAVIELALGRKVSPVWIQRQYYLAALAFVNLHDLSEFQPALAYWSDCLDAFEAGHLQKLVGRVDWVTKLDLLFQSWQSLQGRRIRENSVWSTGLTGWQAYMLDLRYHALTGHKALAAAIRQKYDPPDLYQDIQSAGKTIPPGRPQLRQRVLELARRHRVAAVYMFWSRVCLAITADSDLREFVLLDPYGGDDEVLRQIENYLLGSVKKAA